ncbi:MAG TPA: hypothetical protein VMW80_14045 [Candidatus Dormibacteraeota bacterium]|nr:hypothetical protein [Candidatus Dormibacteraeota bacterium]
MDSVRQPLLAGPTAAIDLPALAPTRVAAHFSERRWGQSLDWLTVRPTREGYALAAVVLLGLGSAQDLGTYHPLGLLAIVGAAVCAVLGATTASGRRAHRLTWCIAAFVGAIAMGFFNGPGLVAWLDPLAGAGAAVLVISSKRTLTRLGGCLVAATATAVVVGKALNVGPVDIDVFKFTQRATLQLLHGRDPYAFAYPTTTPHLPVAHYTDLPGVILLSIPGRLLGDVRLSDMLAVLVLIAAITMLARRYGGAEQGWRCLAICLTLPFFPLMILLAWSEIYLMALIPLWLVLRDQHRLISVVILGVGIATVPTPWPLLILPFLWWRQARLEIFGAALVAIALCFPFALWAGPANFIEAALLVNLHLPPLRSGLDLDSLYRIVTGSWLPVWFWPVGSGSALLMVARAHARTWNSALYLGSTLLLVSFLSAKWAYFDYYFLAAVGLILAMALERSADQVSAPLSRVRVASVAQVQTDGGAGAR